MVSAFDPTTDDIEDSSILTTSCKHRSGLFTGGTCQNHGTNSKRGRGGGGNNCQNNSNNNSYFTPDYWAARATARSDLRASGWRDEDFQKPLTAYDFEGNFKGI